MSSGNGPSIFLIECFGYIHAFQNAVNALSKMVLKNPIFVRKNFVQFGPHDFISMDVVQIIFTLTSKYTTPFTMVGWSFNNWYGGANHTT